MLKVKLKFMHLIRKLLLLILVSILFVACFEKDEAVQPYSGKVYTIPDDIEQFISYFDLETGIVVKVIPADSWQLGFECTKTGWHILVNSGAHWFLKNTYQTEFQTSLDSTQSTSWKYDVQSSFPDSTAAGEWAITQNNKRLSKKEIYLLGKSSGSNYTLLKQLVFESVNDSIYTFSYKNGVSNPSDTVIIHKSDTTNYVYYSFPEKKQVNLEPDKLVYDISFGPYYDVVTEFGVTGPYLVRGVFINETGTEVVLDSLSSYSSIDLLKAKGYHYSNQRDIIGYNWKVVNVDLASGGAKYTIKNNYTYIIHTPENNYFKLHFLSYESKGLPGVTQFDYKKLE